MGIPASTRAERSRRSSILLLTAVVALLTVVTPTAQAANSDIFSSDQSGVVVTDANADCNGIIPTPGSENTQKFIVAGELVPGGTVSYRITFPLDGSAAGEWSIDDCLMSAAPLGDGSYPALKDYDELGKATFEAVINSEDFLLDIDVAIPDDVPIGTKVCNVAKTTSSPSAAQGSNRKAGPACFIVGGDLRIEKHDATTNTLIDESNPATFEITCEGPPGADANLQPVIITPAPDEDDLVESNAIAISGPSGSTCTVTEVSPPDGYGMPPADELTRELVVGVGSAQQVVTFDDPPLEPEVSLAKTADELIVDAGDDIGFTVTATNSGLVAATGVQITDELPDGFTWTEDPDLDECSITAGDLSCDVAELAADADFAVHVSAPTTTDDCGQVENTASASADDHPEIDDADASLLVRCPLDIGIEKTGPDLAHRGDTVTYTIEVTNTGLIELLEVNVTDPVCDEGTLERTAGDDVLDLDETWTYECDHLVTEDDPDPLPNTASATGVDAFDREATASDDHSVDLIAPAIQIEKTASDTTVNEGDEVTYTYEVTNIGDTELFDVIVTDDLLGDIGTIAELGIGATETLTITTTIEDAAVVTNIGTATGVDVLDLEVTDQDSATVTVTEVAVVTITPTPSQTTTPDTVLGVTETRDLPRTGAEISGLVVIAFGLLGAGSATAMAGRWRRQRV